MTDLDTFAAAALTGICASAPTIGNKHIAVEAYRLADEMAAESVRLQGRPIPEAPPAGAGMNIVDRIHADEARAGILNAAFKMSEFPEEFAPLAKFYQAPTVADLLRAQEHHVTRLQSTLRHLERMGNAPKSNDSRSPREG